MLEESERLKSTDRATQEISLRTNAPEEFGYGMGGSRKTVTLIFVTERTGNVSATGETITQRCREISLRGKTPEDRMILWKAGQKVEEAPEQIEEEAARAYELEDRMPQEEDEVKFEKPYSTIVMF